MSRKICAILVVISMVFTFALVVNPMEARAGCIELTCVECDGFKEIQVPVDCYNCGIDYFYCGDASCVGGVHCGVLTCDGDTWMRYVYDWCLDPECDSFSYDLITCPNCLGAGGFPCEAPGCPICYPCCPEYPDCRDWTSEQLDEFESLLDKIRDTLAELNAILDQLLDLCAICVDESPGWILEMTFEEEIEWIQDIISNYEYTLAWLEGLVDEECFSLALEEAEWYVDSIANFLGWVSNFLNIAGEVECECDEGNGGPIETPGEVDRDALAAAIAAAEAKVEGNYTAASWAPFATALEAAMAVFADPNATQEQIDAALAALLAAMDGLVRVGAEDHGTAPCTRVAGAAPKTGDVTTTLPLLAGSLLAISSVLGGTSLRKRLKK